MFIEEPYPANALAITDIVLIRLGREAFFRMLQDHPEVLMTLTKSLCSKLYQKSFINRSMAVQRPEERITTLLRLLKKESGCAIDTQYRLTFSRQQIADMIGLRVETVIRAIKRLEEKGNVIITHGKVYY
jgi:CRP-like cAMP-binding protein